jgi:hypothetical protein
MWWSSLHTQLRVRVTDILELLGAGGFEDILNDISFFAPTSRKKVWKLKQ